MTPTSARPVSVSEAQALMLESNTLVLDVRSPGEFETAHIDGAVNIPVDRLDPHLREIVHNAGGSLVLVCQSGGRAEQAAGKLSSHGKEDVVLLDGGMNAWQQAGAPVRRGDTQRWALERQVRLVAGTIVLASVAMSAWFPRTKWIGAGVGGGLVFAAASNSCVMGTVLGKLPYNQGPACDIDEALTRLSVR
ncbi:rhodanese-like domain-containing protein [Nocardioides sp. J2M5]|uniref:rhodanese-like domain-containing protein n=1 Tax=Nocardioides palaemonis TaxID=2829810 RepID=UPI001BA9DCBA|nr:rhodanese-like domain-containing protein [Nocardioides palaemonis]MBS2937650.1 rhodanese-like domain-containing protein [Nocardioides palaemonis]